MIMVYKYQVVKNGPIKIPKKSKLVHFATQNNTPFLWIEIDTKIEETEDRYFKVFGTGHPVEGKHIGTFFDGPFVWHLYETGPKPE